MYDLTCPYCKKEDSYWEANGNYNVYLPYKCTHCKRWFYLLHRSWFDPYYDNHNVEVHKREWFLRRLDKLEVVGYVTTKKSIKIYKPKWDIYKKSGGEKKCLDEMYKGLEI